MDGELPGDEAEVDVGAIIGELSTTLSLVKKLNCFEFVYNVQLVTEEVLLVLQKAVEDTPNTGNLLEVALLSAGKLLRVELVEPNALAVVGSLIHTYCY